MCSPASSRKTNGHVSYAGDQDDDNVGGHGQERWGVVSKVHDVISRLARITLSVPDQVLGTSHPQHPS